MKLKHHLKIQKLAHIKKRRRRYLQDIIQKELDNQIRKSIGRRRKRLEKRREELRESLE